MQLQIERAVKEYNSLTADQLQAERSRLRSLPIQTPDDKARLIAIQRILSE